MSDLKSEGGSEGGTGRVLKGRGVFEDLERMNGRKTKRFSEGSFDYMTRGPNYYYRNLDVEKIKEFLAYYCTKGCLSPLK